MDDYKANKTKRKKNPLDNSNIFSSVLFCWLLPLFVKGFRKNLTENDLYEHRRSHDSNVLGDKLEQQWIKQTKKSKNPSLIKAIVNVFFTEVVLINIVVIMAEVIRISQPFLITSLIKVYEANRANEDKNEVYFYAALIILTSFIACNLGHNFSLMLLQLGMKLRLSCSSLVYRKSLRLSKSALVETTIGQMVNLLSNDVGRFDIGILFFHNIYIAPTETLVVMYLLYRNVGWTALSGAILLLLFIPFQSWLGKKTSQYRLGTAIRTDERVRLMNEIIAGIQVIKMYTWEYPFAKLVEFVRMKEMKYIRYTSVIRAILMSCILMLNRCAIAASILVYVLTGNSLTATYAYTVTSYYRLLYTITNFFPTAISQAAEMYISTKRLKTFLMYDEVHYENTRKKSTENGKSPYIEMTNTGNHSGVFIKNASAKWLKTSQENSLQDITMEVTSGKLAAVVGAVGSGKTTLLHIIMNELELVSGSVRVEGIVSYASQEAWLFGGTVRQNILFGQKFNQKKYDEVIRVCALRRDLALLPYGDRTLVGERGVALSGGQKARVNLARAVYKEADIYLLDDPLSAVDTHVGKQLFEDCICGYLNKKCVILITHQLQYLKNIKNIYLLKDGKVEVSGSYANLKNSNSDYSKIVADIEEEEEATKRKSVKLASQEKLDENYEAQELHEEEKGVGKIAGRVYLNYAKAGGNKITGIVIASAFIICQVLDSLSEYFVTFWVNIQQTNNQNNYSNNTEESNATSQTENPFEDWLFTPIFIGDLTALYYALLIVILVILILSRSLAFYKWCLDASTKLHNQMFVNIVNSPMRFFNTNPSGRILNRFSKDIGALDETLPMCMLDTIQIGLYVASISVVIGSLTVWIMIPTLVIAVLFYLMKVVFVHTTRDIKRIESVTRSPIFTHLSASLQGLTTVRAFKAQSILKSEFDNYQNLNSAAYFLYVGANRTFGFWLDFLCVVYVAMVILALLFVKSETYGGNMGLALTQAMALTGMFQWGMRQWSEFENQMTSVERVQEYADLKPETDEKTFEPAEAWPERGQIEFRDTSLRYSPNDPYVLKNLDVIIRPMEKIGIVGRTGAGKSSLIQALFRLAPIDGEILIDDVDTKTIALNKLRSSISIIPQEPVLFSGTLRKNLDPFDEYQDDSLWNALKEVELKHAVKELPSGLDSKMAEGGSNFSVGQRQLLCLARAIVRNNKILVLDEATANVDPHTDDLIQKTIRRKFHNCTVLTIAHRLHTIMDSDKVIVMDAGEIVEFDQPYSLLQNHDGVFYSLVKQTGKATAKHLISIAEKSKKCS
ncbi:unnamed protein product [Phyllotreta striolata]|uniref:Uncharacterized protein n=1 Tax=Phyllotreta striolata TaxID=444603 RepID=A0A9N9XMG5_PHYSR|nr:unnamed protein product [Phyllotreta striolata]